MSYLSPTSFFRSLRHAGRGFQRALETEHSFRVHLVAAAVVVVLLLFLHLGLTKTALIVMVITTVLVMELVNTVVERFVDILEPRVHPYVGVIKDLMAAAVLTVSVAAVIIAALVIVPAFWH